MDGWLTVQGLTWKWLAFSPFAIDAQADAYPWINAPLDIMRVDVPQTKSSKNNAAINNGVWDLSPFPLLFIPFVQLHHFTNRKYLIMTWFFLLFLIIPIFCMKSKKIKERKKMEGKFYLMISNKRKCYLFSNAIPFMFSHLHSLCSTFSLNLVITFRYFLIPSLFSRPRIHHPAPATTQFIRIQFDSILLTM